MLEGLRTPMSHFEKRLYIGFGVLVVLFAPILVGAFMVISELEVTQGELLTKNAQDVITAERLSSLAHEEMGLAQGFALRGDPATVKQFEAVHVEFRQRASSMLLTLDPGEDPSIIQTAIQLEKEGYERVTNAIELRRSGASLREINSYVQELSLSTGRRIAQLVEQNVDIQKIQLKEARATADRVAKKLVLGLISACAFAFLATAAIVLLLWQMIRNKAREDRERDERLKLELDLSNARKEAVEVVAHDLKNPLSALKMSHELLREELGSFAAENSDVGMALQIAQRSMQSMQRLIDDQLDHTKIEAGQLSLDRRIVSVSESIRDIEIRFRPLFTNCGLAFHVKADRNLFAEIDLARIEQVLSNLLGNAMKFTPAGGTVELLAKREGLRISISVKDNGPGISLEAREHIFERYWQVKETAKKGTGLGLSIAKGIAEAHGGDLSCSSEPGKGCTFTLSIEAVDVGQGKHFSRSSDLSN